MLLPSLAVVLRAKGGSNFLVHSCVMSPDHKTLAPACPSASCLGSTDGRCEWYSYRRGVSAREAGDCSREIAGILARFTDASGSGDMDRWEERHVLRCNHNRLVNHPISCA
jgi:hypothetical protein